MATRGGVLGVGGFAEYELVGAPCTAHRLPSISAVARAALVNSAWQVSLRFAQKRQGQRSGPGLGSGLTCCSVQTVGRAAVRRTRDCQPGLQEWNGELHCGKCARGLCWCRYSFEEALPGKLYRKLFAAVSLAGWFRGGRILNWRFFLTSYR